MKSQLRNEWRKTRKNISEERRKEAEKNLLALFSFEGLILSYASFKDELSTQKLNQKLAAEKRLVLPRIRENTLWLYRVENCDKDLLLTSFGIQEPDPEKCERIAPEMIDAALVPGIAFDCNNHRLGYGKGYFDRFLEIFQDEFISVGACFQECYSKTPFPSQPHDISLNQIILV